MLIELFDSDFKTETPEVEIAKICQKTIQGVKVLEKVPEINFFDLLSEIPKDVEKISLKKGTPTCSTQLEEFLKKYPKRENPAIGQSEIEKIYSALDEFINYAKKYNEDLLDKVCEYIEYYYN